MKAGFKSKLDYIGLVVDNIEKTLDLFLEVFDVRLSPRSSRFSKLFRIIDSEEGGVRWVLVPIAAPERHYDQPMIEMLEPTRDSHVKEFLKTRGT